MSSTNTPSTRWVVGETSGLNAEGETVGLPSAVFHATATTVPTAADDGGGSNVFITSDDDLYYWDGDAWVGPYSTS